GGGERVDGGVEAGRMRVPAADAVRAPARAGRYCHVVEAVVAYLLRGDFALERELYVRELRELGAAIVHDANPGGEARQPSLAQNTPSALAARLREHDPVAALAERHRGLEPRRAGADDEHLRV